MLQHDACFFYLQQHLEFVNTCGLLSAPGYFAVNLTSGIITVLNPLQSDLTVSYQVIWWSLSVEIINAYMNTIRDIIINS